MTHVYLYILAALSVLKVEHERLRKLCGQWARRIVLQLQALTYPLLGLGAKNFLNTVVTPASEP